MEQLEKSSGEELAATAVTKARNRYEYQQANEEGYLGWSTGFDKLDRIIGGFPRPGLYLLGGGPGVGKTSLAVHIARSVARDVPVFYVTLENHPVSLLEKILVAEVNGTPGPDIQIEGLRRGLEGPSAHKELDRRRENLDFLRRLYFFGPDSAVKPTSVQKLESIIDNVRSDLPCALDGPREVDNRPDFLVVVDYLQRWAKWGDTASEDDTLRERVEKMGDELSRFRLHDMEAAVLALASQNRQSGYGRGNTSSENTEFQASLSSLKESGDLEYMADVAMFLVSRRPGLVSGDDVRPLTLEVLKNRHGRTGKVDLTFKPHRSTFHQAD